MRRVENFEDMAQGVVTFELEGGQRLRIDARVVRKLGIKAIMRRYVYGEDKAMPDKRIPVYQCGRRIGTLPEWFDPLLAKSNNWLYEPRTGDFKRTAEGWEAISNLGPGDLDALPEFRWDDAETDAGRDERNRADNRLVLSALAAATGTAETVQLAQGETSQSGANVDSRNARKG